MPYQTDRKGTLYLMMHSVGLVQYKNKDFERKLHLVSVVGIYSLLLAHHKILNRRNTLTARGLEEHLQITLIFRESLFHVIYCVIFANVLF